MKRIEKEIRMQNKRLSLLSSVLRGNQNRRKNLNQLFGFGRQPIHCGRRDEIYVFDKAKPVGRFEGFFWAMDILAMKSALL